MSGDGDATSPEPTVASILGIQGPLRFRTHGATQKAHVVLRQVDLSEESEDEGDGKPMIYFSLFAQKRIEVKPGKEILLAVATPDGRFIDTPVMFAGEAPHIESKPPEGSLQKASTKLPTPAPPSAPLPPRLRKTWHKVEPPCTPSVPPAASTHKTVGVQCDLTFESQSVQTDSEPVIERISSSVQTEARVEPLSTTAVTTVGSASVQADEAPQTVNEVVAAPIDDVPASPVSEPYSPTLSVNLGMNFTGRDRSLSPMELDSPGSSPTLTPPALPMQPSDERPKSMSLSPPALSVSTPPSSVPPGLDVHYSPLKLFPEGEPADLAVSSSQTSAAVSVLAAVERPIIPSRVSGTESFAVFGERLDVNAATTQDPKSEAAAYKPRRKSVPNPFVSGGLLTDFVSGSAAKARAEAGMAQIAETTGVPPVTPTAAAVQNSVRDSVAAATAKISEPPTSITSFSHAPLPTPSPSSSKVKVEDIRSDASQLQAMQPMPEEFRPPFSRPSQVPAVQPYQIPTPRPYEAPTPAVPTYGAPVQQLPSPPALDTHVQPLSTPERMRPPPALPTRMTDPLEEKDVVEKPVPILMPPRTSHGFFPPGPIPPRPPKKKQTPPETRPQAYVPPPSYNNPPLGIQPSGAPSFGARQPYQQQQPIEPPRPMPQQNGNKQRGVVSNGWPFAKQANGTPTRATGGNINVQQHNDTNRRASWGAPAPAMWPEPSPTPPRPPMPPPPPSGMWPMPEHQQELDEEYDPRNPMNGFGLPPPPPPPPFSVPRRDNMYPPPPSNIPHHFVQQQYATPTASSQPSRASSIDTSLAAPPGGFQPDLPPPYHYHHPPPPSINTSFIPPQRPSPINGQAITPTHPLPPKPQVPKFNPRQEGAAWSPKQGVKRMASPEPVSPQPQPELKQSDMFKWPILDAVHASRVKGDEEVTINSIVFSSDGNFFAVTCHDKTVRIWNNRTRNEIARLGHTMPVLAVAWMENDSGVVTLGDNGIVSTWTRNVQNKWQWAKILDAGGRNNSEKPICFAFGVDRIAIAFPKGGVKVWLFINETWFAQRSILQHNVTTIKFVDDGEALMGATADGVLWHCGVPNGILKVSAFLKAKVLSLDVEGRHAVVSLANSCSQLLTISSDDHKGTIEKTYHVDDPELQGQVQHDFGALFASRSYAIAYGAVRGCVMIWDRSSADVSYGLLHGENDLISAVSCFEGGQISSTSQIVTGTRDGRLAWFIQPNEGQMRKRVKIA